MSDIVNTEATGPLGDEWAAMTFPAYRPLLAVIGSVNPVSGGRPVARCATDDGRPVGLVIAEITPGDEAAAELLSVFVVADRRGEGVATRLLERLEDDVRRLGASRLAAVYMTGKPAIAAIEHIFRKRGFPPPEVRKVVVRFTPEEAATTEWYRKAKLPAGSEVFAWSELTPRELDELKRTQSENQWIEPDLEPWRMSDRFDVVSSVGLRKDGQVVGWVINHPIGPQMLCFTTSFMRRDLARRGAIFPLYVASIERLKGTGVTCTFVTSSQFASMVRFVLRRCAPFISFCGETRGVSRRLVDGTPATPPSLTHPIEIIDNFEDRSRWDAFVEAHSSGHFFQSWTWGEMQRGLGARPRRFAVVSNGQICGALQMLVFQGATRPFAVVPRGPVADPDDVAVVQALLAAAREAGRSEGTFLLRVEPQWEWSATHVAMMEACGFVSAKQWIMPRRTLLVDLRPATEAIWAGFKSNTRNRVRLAEKLGVDVRVATDAGIPIFEQLFEQMSARHGLRQAARETFGLAAKAYARTDTMRLYLARSRDDGVDISGIIVFVAGRTATYLWGASSDAESARKLNPNQLLHWTAMQWAKSQGCETYDTFGIPDHDRDVLEAEYARQHGGMWNLYRFKRGFGGTVVRHLGTFDHVYRS